MQSKYNYIMRKFSFYLICILLCFIAFALIYNPSRYISVCYQAIILWAVNVLPSLLPFFFLTLLLTYLDAVNMLAKLFSPITAIIYRTSGYASVVQLMSFVSGYPVGAKLISELYNAKQINSDEATRISTFSSTSGPMFIIGSVGVGMFKNSLVGALLLIAHLISAILNGILFRKYGACKCINTPIKNKSYQGNILYDCAYNTTLSCLIIGTFIAFFNVFCQIVIDFNLLYPLIWIFNLIFKNKNLSMGLITGLIECTNGCFILSANPNTLSVALAGFLISFGGLCIILQSIAFLKQANVNIKIFILSKIIQGLTTFTLLALLSPIFICF